MDTNIKVDADMSVVDNNIAEEQEAVITSLSAEDGEIANTGREIINTLVTKDTIVDVIENFDEKIKRINEDFEKECNRVREIALHLVKNPRGGIVIEPSENGRYSVSYIRNDYLKKFSIGFSYDFDNFSSVVSEKFVVKKEYEQTAVVVRKVKYKNESERVKNVKIRYFATKFDDAVLFEAKTSSTYCQSGCEQEDIR